MKIGERQQQGRGGAKARTVCPKCGKEYLETAGGKKGNSWKRIGLYCPSVICDYIIKDMVELIDEEEQVEISMMISMVAALEKLAELNNYEEILIQTIAGEPVTIDNEIENIRNFAENPEETFDLYVTADGIKELADGNIKSGEAIYRVIR